MVTKGGNRSIIDTATIEKLNTHEVPKQSEKKAGNQENVQPCAGINDIISPGPCLLPVISENRGRDKEAAQNKEHHHCLVAESGDGIDCFDERSSIARFDVAIVDKIESSAMAEHHSKCR